MMAHVEGGILPICSTLEILEQQGCMGIDTNVGPKLKNNWVAGGMLSIWWVHGPKPSFTCTCATEELGVHMPKLV